MSIFDEIWNWQLFWKIQSQISCQRLHTTIWCWLWEYLHFCYLIWLAENFADTHSQISVSCSYHEYSEHLSEFRIEQDNIYESFRESETSIWWSLWTVKESIWIEAVSKSVKQKDHQNTEVSRIQVYSCWCQHFHSFTEHYSDSLHWWYAHSREKSEKDRMC